MQLPIYVNLHTHPLSVEDFEFIAVQKLHPELYFSGDDIDDLSPEKLEKIQAEVKKQGFKPTLHAPFLDLNVGAFDPKVREASRERLLWTIRTAQSFGASLVVVHPGSGPWVLTKHFDRWLERAKPVLSDLVAKAVEAGVKIAFENIYDDHPEDLATILNLFPKESAGICFDLGHFNLFSKVPMKTWLDVLGPRIFEVHLHDNLGANDDHIAIGDGNIKFGTLLNWLKSLESMPFLTLEMEQKTHVIKSVGRLRDWMAEGKE